MSQLSIEAAWNALWKAGSPYNLPATFKSRRHVGQVWLGHLPQVTLADTGPVVLMNQEPWGVVSVNLKNAAVSNLHTVEPVSFEHNKATGEVTAEVQFRQLRYGGDYEVRRGTPTASALKLASAQLRRPDALDAADPNDNISLAKSYQDQLSLESGPNGSVMLDAYYRNNDAYASAFGNTIFARNWATLKTSGQTTSDFAAHTAVAATPGNTGTVSVNGTPNKYGVSAYNAHSISMQMLLVTTCNKQGNQDAATAASCFKTATNGPAASSQTVDSVMNIVQSSPTPNGCSQQQVGAALVLEPAWQTKLRQELQPIMDEIEREEDDVATGVRLREETNRPIHGKFNAYFPTHTLTLTGKLDKAANGTPQVKFTSVSGAFGDVPVRLGAFPGKLHPELSQSIDKAQFLKSILGKRVISAIASSKLKDNLGHLLTVAMNEG
jgi:hypothetical protein